MICDVKARGAPKWSRHGEVLSLGLVSLAVLSFALSDGDLFDVVWNFSIGAGLFGLFVLCVSWETRRRGRVYEARWRSICHVLGEDHDHEGTVLTGRWKGKPFRAGATAFSVHRYRAASK